MLTVPHIAKVPRTILALLLVFVSATGFATISCGYSGHVILSQWNSQTSEPMGPDGMSCCAEMSVSVFERICQDVPECDGQQKNSEANTEHLSNVFLTDGSSCLACNTDSSAFGDVKISSDTVKIALYAVTSFIAHVPVHSVSPRVVAHTGSTGASSLPIYARFSAYRI